MNSTLLEAVNITFEYQDSGPILKNFSFTLNRGDFAGLIGPNGAGKTTVIKILCGFLKPHQGSILLKGCPIKSVSSSERSKLLATVSQNVFTPMPYTVRQIVEMGRVSRISRFGGLGRHDKEAVYDAMEQMNIADKAEKLFNHLSGGEKQRAMIAMALAQEPEIMLLDEPTSSLDIGHSFNLMKMLQELNRDKGITVLLISHDIQLAANFCSRILLLKNGEILSDGTPEDVITKNNIEKAYSCKTTMHRSHDGKIMLAPD